MNIATVFSGIGTPEIALKELNIKHKSVFACEIDKYARKTFLENSKTEKFYENIYDINGTKYENKIDLFIGGSPCQSFSLSGKRLGINDKRGQLIYEYYRMIEEIKPKIFMYENVKGFTNIDKGETLKNFINSFKDLGYTIYYKILNTANYNIPQNRERIYIIGFKEKEEFEFPKQEKLKIEIKDLLEKKVEEKYYLKIKTNESLNKYKNKYVFCAQRGRYNEDGSISQKIEFRKDYLSNTITTVQKDYYLFDGYKFKFRKLTPKEAFNFQGFYNIKFPSKMSDSQLYKQAGNAMSLNILKELIKQILKD
jgi:DNA (cytosine-5)-methyltransferase 1